MLPVYNHCYNGICIKLISNPLARVTRGKGKGVVFGGERGGGEESYLELTVWGRSP